MRQKLTEAGLVIELWGIITTQKDRKKGVKRVERQTDSIMNSVQIRSNQPLICQSPALWPAILCFLLLSFLCSFFNTHVHTHTHPEQTSLIWMSKKKSLNYWSKSKEPILYDILAPRYDSVTSKNGNAWDFVHFIICQMKITSHFDHNCHVHMYTLQLNSVVTSSFSA